MGSTPVESVYRCEKELNRIWYFVGHSLDFSDRLLTGRRKFCICFLKFHNLTHQRERFPNKNTEDDWTSILSRYKQTNHTSSPLLEAALVGIR